MPRAGRLTPGLFVLGNLRARPARSALTVAGIAVAVAFFVLFAALSTGLGSFIDEELSAEREVHVILVPGGPTPFDDDDLAYVDILVGQALGDGVEAWSVQPRISLPLSITEGGEAVTLYGVEDPTNTSSWTHPYDASAPLAEGNRLGEPGDDDVDPDIESSRCVLGWRARQALFPSKGVGSYVTLGFDGTVDPWWFANARDYPLEGLASYVAVPTGGLRARVNGILEEGSGGELDWGVFVPLRSLLFELGQVHEGAWYYPELVVTLEGATSSDVRALETVLAQELPGVTGTDDAWDEEAFSQTYGAASEALDGWLVVVAAVMTVMLLAGVTNTMLVTVSDRRREIATLRAVGTSGTRVTSLLLGESTVLAGLGLAVGLLAGGGLAAAFDALHETTGGEGVFLAPVELGHLAVLGAAVLALGTALLATLYPARRALGEPPTEALRYE